jgi:hypothetical protein
VILHGTTKSTRKRDVSNPLFAINQTEAMARDLMGRLRRQSWLVSKKRRYLDIALALFIAWRNLVRRRFNYDEESPAQSSSSRRGDDRGGAALVAPGLGPAQHPSARWNAESIERCVNAGSRRLVRCSGKESRREPIRIPNQLATQPVTIADHSRSVFV